MLHSTLYIISSSLYNCLKLLRPTAKGEMQLHGINYLTFDRGQGHTIFAQYIMWPIHLQSSKLPSTSVKEEMELQ